MRKLLWLVPVLLLCGLKALAPLAVSADDRKQEPDHIYQGVVSTVMEPEGMVGITDGNKKENLVVMDYTETKITLNGKDAQLKDLKIGMWAEADMTAYDMQCSELRVWDHKPAKAKK